MLSLGEDVDRRGRPLRKPEVVAQEETTKRESTSSSSLQLKATDGDGSKHEEKEKPTRDIPIVVVPDGRGGEATHDERTVRLPGSVGHGGDLPGSTADLAASAVAL